jgi:hypothetical protein
MTAVSSSESMVVTWAFAVIENGIKALQAVGVRTQPRVDVFPPDWDDAAIVADCGNFPWGLVCDRGERQ